MSDYKPVIPVKVRTARKQHDCRACLKPIRPGEQYQIWSAPPWRDDNESPRWAVVKSHLGAFSDGGHGCDESAAYAEKQRREQVNGG